jgi:hypothetical protein
MKYIRVYIGEAWIEFERQHDEAARCHSITTTHVTGEEIIDRN